MTSNTRPFRGQLTEVSRTDVRYVAVVTLLTLQLLAVLFGNLLAPRVWDDVFGGDAFALAIVAMWLVPPALSLGLGALRKSTHPALWWLAYLLLGLALLYLAVLTFGAYAIGEAIREDGLIT